jgi:ATP-dependent DNA helicase RecQ
MCAKAPGRGLNSRHLNFYKLIRYSYLFDSEEEQEFWSGLQSKTDNLSSKLAPQIYTESLIPEYQASNTRIDFLGLVDGSLMVIEIDGAQHSELHQSTVDSTRDTILANAGFETKRIPTAKIDQACEDLSFDDVSVQTSAAHAAHVIHVAIGKAIKLGVLPLKGTGWEIEIIINNDDDLLRGLISVAAKGAFKHLSNLARILGLDDALPNSVSFKLNGKSIYQYGSALTDDDPETKYIFIHFDQIPSGELAESHFYYREFPTSFAVMMDVTDAMTTSIQPDLEIAQYFLNYFFRFKSFRDGQWEGLERTLYGLDSLVLMPTGHGKSMIYQLASLLRPGTALVIDPIISLMDDQIHNLSDFGITRAIAISSQVEANIRRETVEQFSQGQFIFAFVSPERLQMTEFRKALRSLTSFTPVSAVVIDETHCVSEWGHDFRTSYLNLGRNSREFCTSKDKVPPLLGLTGTASRSVLKDVKRELEIFDFDAVITPQTFDRSNLKFRVVNCTSNEKFDQLRGILSSLPSNFGMSFNDFYKTSGDQTKCGLIFCPHVNGKYGVAEVASLIDAELRIQTMFYSGSNPKKIDPDRWDALKSNVAHRFKSNQLPLMTATKAFGMGIDKPNVRYSIHYGIPSSIESFYQEAGRTGRDGSDSLCYIIASNDDRKRTAKLLSETSSISSVKDTVESTKYDDSDDILRSLFFHTQSFQGLKSELKEIKKVLDAIDAVKGITDVTVKADGNMKNREKAIHRLVVIGYVKDYTVDYSGKCFNLRLSEASSDELRESLLRYVRNYQISRAKALEKNLEESPKITKSFLLHLTEKVTTQVV